MVLQPNNMNSLSNKNSQSFNHLINETDPERVKQLMRNSAIAGAYNDDQSSSSTDVSSLSDFETEIPPMSDTDRSIADTINSLNISKSDYERLQANMRQFKRAESYFYYMTQIKVNSDLSIFVKHPAFTYNCFVPTTRGDTRPQHMHMSSQYTATHVKSKLLKPYFRKLALGTSVNEITLGDLDELINEYTLKDQGVRALLDRTVKEYSEFISIIPINLPESNVEPTLHLIPALTKGQWCIEGPEMLAKLIERRFTSDPTDFFAWFTQEFYQWNPFLGNAEMHFITITPELFSFLLGSIGLVTNRVNFRNICDILRFHNRLTPTTLERTQVQILSLQLEIAGLERKINGNLQSQADTKQALKKLSNSQNNNHRREEFSKKLEMLRQSLAKKTRYLEQRKDDLTRMVHPEPVEIKPAMEMQNEVQTVFHEATNTAIATGAIETETILMDQPPMSILSELLTDQNRKFPALTDRFVLFDRITVNSTITRGTVIAQYHMPADFIIANWNDANMLPFKVHEYFRGSIEMEFQTNIPKTSQFYFRYGVVYNWLQRDRRDELVNVHTISQQAGGRINGSIAGTDNLSIPFFSYAPNLPIRPNTSMLNMYMCTVSLIAMSNFEIATGAIPTAEINVYAKFSPDLEFYGQRQIINGPPAFVIPNPTLAIEEIQPAMLSLGTMVATSAKAQATSALSGLAGSLLGTANNIVRGTVKTATNVLTKSIESTISQGLSSLGSNRDKPTEYHCDALHQRASTNIASGSGLFHADSYRLQQVGSTPHPLFCVGKEKYDTIQQLIETLGFVNSFTISTANNTGDSLMAIKVVPGNFSPLISGGNFPNNISNWTPLDHMAGWFTNFHGRQHFRFECVVDGFKTFRLRVAYVPDSQVLTYEQSNSVYFETFTVDPSLEAQTSFDFFTPFIHNQLNFQTRQIPTNQSGPLAAYQCGSIHVFLEVPINMPAQLFPSLDVLVFKRAMPGEFTFTVPRNNISLLKVTETDLPAIPDPEPPLPIWTRRTLAFEPYNFAWSNATLAWTISFRIFIDGILSPVLILNRPSDSRNRVELNGPTAYRSTYGLNTESAALQIYLDTLPGLPGNVAVTMQYGNTQNQIMITQSNLINGTRMILSYETQGITPVVTVQPSEPIPTVEIHPAMDIRESYTDAANLTPGLTPLDAGIHGESHMHLYENLRRLNYWHSVSTTTVESNNVRIFSIPCNFGAPLLRQYLNDAQRSDKITHLHDAFRFVRGGLRYLLTISSTANGILRTVHTPQINNYPFTIDQQLTNTPYQYPGFAESIISLQQNNISTHEIPMYIPTNAILCASYLSDENLTNISQGLGSFSLYWQGPPATLSINVSRALADDAQFYNFNGFPIREPIPGSGTGITFFQAAIEEETINPAGLRIMKDETERKLQDGLDSFTALSNTLQDFHKRMVVDGEGGVLIGTLFTQIAHVIVNPTLTTFCLSVWQLLMSFRIITLSSLEHLSGMLKGVWNKVADYVKPAGNGIDDDINDFAELSTTIIAGMVGFFDPKAKNKNLGFTEKLSFVVEKSGTIHTRILSFVKSLLAFCKKAATFVVNKLFPESILANYLNDDFIETWISRVETVTDVTNWVKIKQSRKAAALVYKLCAQGHSLNMQLAKSRKSLLASAVTRANVKINQLKEKIGITAHIPVIKYDPFCFYLSGTQSQIGKSHMLAELVREIMIENNIMQPDESDTTYVVPESDKFWTGYTNQRCIIFDDFARNTPTEVTESDCSYLCNLKGEAKWEVPKAFNDKGCQSVVKLVACASNQSHPKHNGISVPKIVWARRNACYSVKSDTSCYVNCGEHQENGKSAFQFNCAACLSINKETDFSLRAHLTFQKYDAAAETFQAIGQALNYAEFKGRLKESARTYYSIHDANYAIQISKYAQETNDPQFNNYCVPHSAHGDYRDLVSSEFYDNVIEEAHIVKPAGLFRDIGAFIGVCSSDYEEVQTTPNYVCPHDRIASLVIHPITYGPLTWSLVSDPLSDEEQIINEDDACISGCPWIYHRSAYLSDLYESLAAEGKVPLDFPVSYNKSLKQQMRAEIDKMMQCITKNTWYQDYSSFLTTSATILGACGVIATCYWLFKPDDGSSTQLPLHDIAAVAMQNHYRPLEITRAHPALMSSGDVGTKFVAKLRTIATKFSTIRPATIKPASDTEYSAMKSLYELSTIDLYDSERNYTARCISVYDKVYLTQLHAFCAAICATSTRVRKEFDKCKACPEDQNHSPECVKKCNELHPLYLVKRNENGTGQGVKLTVVELMRMNRSLFGVDSEGSDMVTFNLDIGNFRTPNVSRYLVTERNNYVDTKNMEFYDPGHIKGIPADYPWNSSPFKIAVPVKENYHKADDVQNVNMLVKYPASQVSHWTTHNEDVKCKMYGFTIKNPAKGGNQGACGSVLFCKTTGSIVGIMSGASQSTLYFNATSKEQIKDAFGFAMTNHSTNAKGESIYVSPKEIPSVVELSEDVAVLSVSNGMNPAMKIYHSTKTNIRKSVCHEQFGPVVRAPCNMSQNNDHGQTAMVKGLAHYRPHLPFPSEHMRLTHLDLESMYLTNCKLDMDLVTRRSIREAIEGIPGRVARLQMSTSPGFPWCCDPKYKRKSDLIEFDDENRVSGINSILLDQIREEERMMEAGEVPLTIFQLSLKDERLALEKLNNVRLIQGSPMALTINSRRYLMDFIYAFQISRNNLEHCVGINPESLEWNTLARSLIDHSPYICVGDFSKFGPRLLNDFVTNSYKMIASWYGDFDQGHTNARLIIGERIINSKNICFNEVVELKCGSPSGAITTVVTNTICAQQYIRCAWIGVMSRAKPEIAALHHFKTYVRFYAYGDDVIFSVKEEIIDLFNNQTISDYLAEFDVKYTDITKNGTMRPHCTIEEATFLKRGFKFFDDTPMRPGVWIGVPNLAESLDITNWVRKPKGTKTGSDTANLLIEAAICNCEDAIRKSWAHGRHVFEEIQTKIRSYWAPLNPPRMPTFYTFEGLQMDMGIPIWQNRDNINKLFPDVLKDDRFTVSTLPPQLEDDSFLRKSQDNQGESYKSSPEPVTVKRLSPQKDGPDPAETHIQCLYTESEAKTSILSEYYQESVHYNE
jgi:hypothetical protein